MVKARPQPSVPVTFRMYVLVVIAVRKYPVTWNTDFSGGLTDRGYTMHSLFRPFGKHLDDFGLINMNGRVYDPLLGRFLSPDNHIQAPGNPQNYNRYAYALNNPLKYTDPSGEWFVIDDLIAAGIGGTINLTSQILSGNLSGMDFWETVGKGAAAFGSGAAQGTLSLYGPAGWAAGGAITGATNAWLSGAGQEGIITGAIGGTFAGAVGGIAGSYAASGLSGVLVNGFNVTSPVVKGAIGGAIGGGVGGYTGGYASAYMMTGDADAAHEAGMNGLWSGLTTGAISGAGGGYIAAKKAGLNPWNGKPNKSITIGEGMETNPQKGWLGVDKIADDFDSDIFNPKNRPIENWYTDDNLMLENANWIETSKMQGHYILDRGTVGNNSQYYNMEVGRTMNYPVIKIKSYYKFYNGGKNIRMHIYYKDN